MTRILRPTAAMLALGAIAGLLSCGKPAEPTADTAPDASTGAGGQATTTYVFGVIAKSQSNPVFQAARTGAFEAARDIEANNPGVSVEIRWETPSDEDAQIQAQKIAQLAAAGVDGITVSCTSAELLTPAINDAVDAGVDVVTFDSDAPDSKRFAYYGIDDVQAGREVMRQLAAAMGGKGVVAVLGGNQSAPNLQARIRGVEEEAASHPDIEVKHKFYHPETAPDAAAKVQSEQQANPDITGWAMVGGWPLFTTNALDGVHQVAKVVSVDHLPEQLQYVRDGQVQALIGQDCYGWGYETVMMLFNKAHHNKAPEQAINTFDLQIVTPENVEEYEGIWDKWVPNG
jgi:ribose transport system substrate-binding protein